MHIKLSGTNIELVISSNKFIQIEVNKVIYIRYYEDRRIYMWYHKES